MGACNHIMEFTYHAASCRLNVDCGHGILCGIRPQGNLTGIDEDFLLRLGSIAIGVLLAPMIKHVDGLKQPHCMVWVAGSSENPWVSGGREAKDIDVETPCGQYICGV